MSFAHKSMCKTKMCASSGPYYVLRLDRMAELFNMRRIESQRRKNKYLPAKIFIRLLRLISKMTTWNLHGRRICSRCNTHTDTQTWGPEMVLVLPWRWYSQTVTNKECWLSFDFLKNMQKMSISLLAKQCHMGPHWP